MAVLPLTLLITSHLSAHDATDKKIKAKQETHSKWSGNIKIGLDSSAGNTNTSVIKGAGQIVHNKDFNKDHRFRNTAGISFKKGDRAKDRDADRIDTVDREAANYKVDYYLTDRSSARAFIFYESDNLAKIESFLMTGLGYSYDVLKAKRHTITLGGGISKVDLQYTDNSPSVEGPSGRLSLKYKGKISKNITLNQKLIYLGVDDNSRDDLFTVNASVTSIEYAFNKKASIVLEHDVTKYSSIPTTAIDTKDDNTGLSLKLKF